MSRLSDEQVESIIETVNERAQEIRSLMITLASIIALLMPGLEAVGILDFTPYGEGDDEWITDDDCEMGSVQPPVSSGSSSYSQDPSSSMACSL